MTRSGKTVDGALACVCIAALAFGVTAAWSRAAPSQPKTSMTKRTTYDHGSDDDETRDDDSRFGEPFA
jgi:hypothetical protein